MIAVAVAAIVSGCGHDASLLDTVPADVMAVGLVDLKKVCSEAGLEFGDKGVTPSETLAGRLDRQTLNLLDVAAMLDREGVADMHDVALVADGAHNAYLTFFINNFEKFKQLCGTNVEWTGNRDGYQTANIPALGDCRLIAVKDQVWLTQADVKAVRALRESAKELSVSQLDGLRPALDGARSEQNIALAVESEFLSRINGVNQTSEIEPRDKSWLVVGVGDGLNGSLSARWSEIASDGQPVKAVGMRAVNPALLAYVPADYTMAVALGVNGDFNWKPVEQLALWAGGFQGAAFMSVAAPYLQSIDGTVLLAGRPREVSTAGDLADWDFILLAHMPRKKIQGLMSMVRTMLFTGGITPHVDEHTGIMSFPQYGGMFYMGEVDGCLGIATRPFDNTLNNPLAPAFVNKDLALSVDLGVFMPYLAGLTLDASMTDDSGQANINVADGSDMTVISRLLSF